MSRATSSPSPWLFAFASAPYGCFNGLVAVALPYVLRRHGISVERIAVIAAMVQAPTIWYFLWAPIVDIGLRRRTWVIVLSVASAVFAAVAIGHDTAPSIRLLAGLLIAASALNQPISSAIGGLIASVTSDGIRGRAAGWSQAGMLGGGVLAGGVAVWLSLMTDSVTTAIGVGLLIAGPAFAVLAIREPSRAKTSLHRHLGHMIADVTSTLKRRDTWVGLVLFMSPVGAGALMNLFSAVSGDFHASPAMVIWVVVIAGLLTPAGALAGGIICDRFDRWRVYPVAGLTAAVSAGVAALAPLTPATYLACAGAYALATGFCYTAFMALALDLTGASGVASGTRFTLFMAATNVPVVYMLRLDGLGHAHFGVRGMLGMDALANAVFGIILLGMVGPLRSAVGTRVPDDAVAPA